MKKILSILTFVLVITSLSFAQKHVNHKSQANKNPEERAEAVTKRMSKYLNLDAAQIERIKGFNLGRFKTIAELKASPDIKKEDLRNKVKELNQNYQKDIQSILTPEQFTKYEARRKEMKERAIDKRKAKADLEESLED